MATIGPIEIDGWQPKNAYSGYYGQIPLSRAFAISSNTAAIRIAQDVGPDEVIDTARDLEGHARHAGVHAAGVVIATDYFGASGEGPLPDVVTMNQAQENHFTDFPDPAIPHVLRGWNPDGAGPAEHLLTLRDVTIRNVTTDLRGWGAPGKDGNSIFVFEVADMCIGHLGHLHYELTEAQYALLGRLDIVMAPVDGTFTLEIGKMIEVLKTLKARLVLPMHSFGQYSLTRFLDGMKDEFEIVVNDSRTITVSLDTLPSRPTVMVLPTRFPIDYE